MMRRILSASRVGKLDGKTTLNLATNDDKFKSSFYDYGILLPLISACHTKIHYELNGGWPNFKVEYIIPQIILQWLKGNNRLIDRIRYFCNRINPANRHEHENVYNFVFTVKCVPEGCCPELQNIFLATDVIDVKDFLFTSADLPSQIAELQEKLMASSFAPLPI